jgi:hypothetical protein
MCLTIEHDERSELSMLQSVLLWSMRAWAVGSRRGIPVEERIEEVFATIGAPQAAGHIYAFIWIVGHCATRMVEVDCVCNPRISADERCLLEILALAQHGRSSEALVLLRSLISDEAAAAAADSAQLVMNALTACGQLLAPPPPPARKPTRLLDAMAAPSRQSATVH